MTRSLRGEIIRDAEGRLRLSLRRAARRALAQRSGAGGQKTQRLPLLDPRAGSDG